jgi:DNA polymerase (family 10)
VFGVRMAQHIRQGLTETHAMLIYRADNLRSSLEEFLLGKCTVKRAQVTGDFRRRVEVVGEISFLVETNDFPGVVGRLQRFGGRTPLVSANRHEAVFALSAGILLRLRAASEDEWGLRLIACTGSKAHLKKLTAVTGPFRRFKAHGSWPEEAFVYEKFDLAFIEPELREGHDEVDRAAAGSLPDLVSAARHSRRSPRAFHVKRRRSFDRANGSCRAEVGI